MSRFIHPILVIPLRILGGMLFLLGVISFLLGPQHGTSSYDYTQTLTNPQPICGGKIQAGNGRIYLFNEELCSVNVYAENGDFIFCVRGSRFQNGLATFNVIEDLGIFIEGRNHILYRFDEKTGAYLGRVEDGALYDANGIFRMRAQDTVVFFTDNWYCFSKYNEVNSSKEFWLHTADSEEYWGTEKELYQGREMSGNSFYFAFFNSLYVSKDGDVHRLSSTPFYLTVFYSPFLAWGIGIAGLLMLKLADRLDQLVQRNTRKKDATE